MQLTHSLRAIIADQGTLVTLHVPSYSSPTPSHVTETAAVAALPAGGRSTLNWMRLSPAALTPPKSMPVPGSDSGPQVMSGLTDCALTDRVRELSRLFFVRAVSQVERSRRRLGHQATQDGSRFVVLPSGHGSADDATTPPSS